MIIKYCDTKEFVKLPLDSKLQELNEFQDELKLLYYDTEEVKPVTEDQKKDLVDQKNVINRLLIVNYMISF